MSEISRYRVSAEEASQWQPGSRQRVLCNLLGITNKRDADQAEYDALLAVQEKYLSIISNETRFTAELLRTMHRDWLGHIYPWAGEYRTVELSKGGFRWPPARLVRSNMATFSRGTLRRFTPCISEPGDGTLLKVAQHIAVVHAEFLLIHPFRDGNGRMARWLSNLMALQAGVPEPSYRFTGKGGRGERVRYLEAVKHGYLADYNPLTNYFLDAFARAGFEGD